MNRAKLKLTLLAVASLVCGLRAGTSTAAAEATAQEPSATGAEREQLLAKGKAIFVEKCAKCHNERGDKELSSGKPLSERGLSQEAIAKTARGRLSKGTEEEQRAVAAYITSFMKGASKAEAKP